MKKALAIAGTLALALTPTASFAGHIQPTNAIFRQIRARGNLHHVNLSGMNLRGRNINSANLSSANLSGAQLNNAFLTNANLSKATMTEACLSDDTGSFQKGIIASRRQD